MINPISFKGYVPVKFYARNPKNGKFSRVIRHENLRKCQSFVVRNLNGTAKNQRNQEFIDYYKKYDSDYRNIPYVTSVYDETKDKDPVIYMITGKDVDTAKQLAKPVGRAKGDSVTKLGHSKSFEARLESNYYFNNIKAFIKRQCRRLKTSDNQNLTLNVFFNPIYNKKQELKGFEYVTAQFEAEEY